jgi:hypothetical protein
MVRHSYALIISSGDSLALILRIIALPRAAANKNWDNQHNASYPNTNPQYPKLALLSIAVQAAFTALTPAALAADAMQSSHHHFPKYPNWEKSIRLYWLCHQLLHCQQNVRLLSPHGTFRPVIFAYFKI